MVHLPQGLNIGCGSQRIPGYLGVDVQRDAEVVMDLRSGSLPFPDASFSSVLCISAINYFTHERGKELIKESYRVLKVDGVARFGVQDMESIARRYVGKDLEFFFQKLPDGRERFEGATLGDKFAAWFYGYKAGTSCVNYAYDFESLSCLFRAAGFKTVERRQYRDSRLAEIEFIDNRPDQMFFLEAVK